MEQENFISLIQKRLDKCIEEFAKQIQYGYGWIAKEDAFRQFTLEYKEFTYPLFDEKVLEDIIINKLSEKVSVKTNDEAFKEGLLDT